MKIPENIGSKYRFIVLAGQRVSQLQRGAKPRIDQSKNKKLTTIAAEELLAEKVSFHEKQILTKRGLPENSEASA